MPAFRSEVAERSIAGQIEFWARLGRAVEPLLRGDKALALRRAGDSRPLSECLRSDLRLRNFPSRVRLNSGPGWVAPSNRSCAETRHWLCAGPETPGRSQNACVPWIRRKAGGASPNILRAVHILTTNRPNLPACWSESSPMANAPSDALLIVNSKPPKKQNGETGIRLCQRRGVLA